MSQVQFLCKFYSKRTELMLNSFYLFYIQLFYYLPMVGWLGRLAKTFDSPF